MPARPVMMASARSAKRSNESVGYQSRSIVMAVMVFLSWWVSVDRSGADAATSDDGGSGPVMRESRETAHSEVLGVGEGQRDDRERDRRDDAEFGQRQPARRRARRRRGPRTRCFRRARRRRRVGRRATPASHVQQRRRRATNAAPPIHSEVDERPDSRDSGSAAIATSRPRPAHRVASARRAKRRSESPSASAATLSSFPDRAGVDCGHGTEAAQNATARSTPDAASYCQPQVSAVKLSLARRPDCRADRRRSAGPPRSASCAATAAAPR